VIATRSARGVLPEDHPLAMVSDPSKRSVRVLNALLDRSDLVLAIGCKFTHNGSYGFKLRLAKEKLVHIDASAAVLNANYPAQLAGCADATAFLDALWHRKDALTRRRPGWSARELAQYKSAAARNARLGEARVHGADHSTAEGFFEALRSAMPAGSCLVTDSGLHQALATRHYRLQEPRGLLIPSDFQSMGFGLPAAIGAKLASPERPIVALIGDGGFLMSGMEMMTAVRERIPITVIVFNDGALGQIRIQQLSAFGHAHGTKVLTPDLAKFAEAIGADYVRLDGDTANAMRAAVNGSGVTLLEVCIGDSVGIRMRQAKGLARQAARVTLNPRLLRWFEAKIGG
jgi:acetolactate synthase-1/2/3 large subunit